MAVITISREFGSKGTEVSQSVSKSLASAYVDKETIEKVMIQFGLISFDSFYDDQYAIWDRFIDKNKEVISLFSKTIREFSKNNNIVIVGRAGFVLLAGYENVLHVLIRAPFEERVQHIMQTMNITDRKKARELVLSNDQSRRTFVQTFYRADTNNTDWFNIVLDSSCVSTDAATNLIVDTAKQLDQKEKSAEKTTFSIESDVVLKEVVEKQLVENKR